MPKISLEEWVEKYAPLRLKEIREYRNSVYLIFEGKNSTLWEIVIGVYGDNFCIAGECYSLLIDDRISRCEGLEGSGVDG